MKHLRLAALAACAFAALFVPASVCTSRKTRFIEFEEFADLTNQRNTMDHTYRAFSGYSRCAPVSQTITSYRSLGVNCYIGDSSLGSEQLTVQCTSISRANPKNHSVISVSRRLALNTGELTVRSATNSEDKSENSSFDSESINPISGTNEGTQLKARLA